MDEDAANADQIGRLQNARSSITHERSTKPFSSL
jgi:hypothetical protein